MSGVLQALLAAGSGLSGGAFAHRYWRIDQIVNIGSTGILEIGELRLFQDSTDISTSATWTYTLTDAISAIPDTYYDGNNTTRHGWVSSDAAALFTKQLFFDFGGSPLVLNGIKNAGYDNSNRSIKTCRLSFSNDSSSYTVVGTCANQTYPGNFTLGPLITFS